LPNSAVSAFRVNVALHGFGSRLSHVDLLPWSAGHAEAFIFVVAVITDVLVAGRATMEVFLSLVLRSDKCLLMLLLPLWGLALERLG
jgi:hypothetical protein